MKKTFKIPVSWEMYGMIEIEAQTLKEALRVFDETKDDMSLPDGEYSDGSFSRSTDESFIRMCQ